MEDTYGAFNLKSFLIMVMNCYPILHLQGTETD